MTTLLPRFGEGLFVQVSADLCERCVRHNSDGLVVASAPARRRFSSRKARARPLRADSTWRPAAPWRRSRNPLRRGGAAALLRSPQRAVRLPPRRGGRTTTRSPPGASAGAPPHRGPLQEVEPLREALEDLPRQEHARSCGGELDGERQVVVTQRGKADAEDARLELGHELGGGVHREAGLARAARARERDEAGRRPAGERSTPRAHAACPRRRTPVGAGSCSRSSSTAESAQSRAGRAKPGRRSR
jgi:hypothetical protein